MFEGWIVYELTISSVPASRQWLVPSRSGMAVHKFPSIVCIIAGFTEPHWEVLIIQTLGNELGVAPCNHQMLEQCEYFVLTYHEVGSHLSRSCYELLDL